MLEAAGLPVPPEMTGKSFAKLLRGEPFEARKYIFAERGAHGHRRLRQIIIAVHGSFVVTVDDGFAQRRFVLDHPSKGLYVGPMVWRDMTEFAPGTVGLWLVSEGYDESEYYRDHDEFLADARRLT